MAGLAFKLRLDVLVIFSVTLGKYRECTWKLATKASLHTSQIFRKGTWRRVTVRSVLDWRSVTSWIVQLKRLRTSHQQDRLCPASLFFRTQSCVMCALHGKEFGRWIL